MISHESKRERERERERKERERKKREKERGRDILTSVDELGFVIAKPPDTKNFSFSPVV